jgi:nitrogen regulation protein NR(I)
VINSGNILLIEDDSSAADALRQVLTDEGYEVAVVTRGDDGLARAEEGRFDLVLTDLRLPGLDGLDLIRRLHASRPRLPIVLMTAHGTTETAIEATKQGAYDYLLKPFEMGELIALVTKAVVSSRLMTEPVEMGEATTMRDAIVGNSRAMQAIYKEIGRVAAKPVTVLIRGETGTGKELIARALYQHSERANEAFVAVNCAAIPETLLESELFGHERGAFTGADTRRIGRFEQAHRGTIFLDEVGEMSLSTQAKLLRVLQEKCIQRLGGRETIPLDVRVIAATHRDLEAGLAEKSFREDLYYRLKVVVIQLPPLRERIEDIPALIRYFLHRSGAELGVRNPSIQPEAVQFLQGQPWRGNVRELENLMRQAILVSRGYPIGVELVRDLVAQPHRSALGTQSLARQISDLVAAARAGELEGIHARVMEEVERELFGQAIRAAEGNRAKAARWLGVSRVTMREKINRYGLNSDPDGQPD